MIQEDFRLDADSESFASPTASSKPTSLGGRFLTVLRKFLWQSLGFQVNTGSVTPPSPGWMPFKYDAFWLF